MNRWTPKLGEVVAVNDTRLDRWRRGTVKGVNSFHRVCTVWAGNVVIGPMPIEPKYVRPIRIAYCRDCAAGRAA